MRVSLRLTLFFVVLGIAVPAAQAGLLVSVDFGTTNTGGGPPPSPLVTGSESAAATADPLFAAANIWNAVNLPEFFEAAAVNPSFSSLVDNNGNATSVGLSFTGNVKGFSGFNNPSTDALRKDYLFLNSSNHSVTSLDWVITGLTPGSEYKLFAYGGNRANRSFNLSVDTTGTGNFVTQLVSGNSGTTYYSSLTADGAGMISGQILGIGPVSGGVNEANWSGFQLAEAAPPVSVPEPGSLTLAGLGALGMAVGAWRRRRQPTA